MEKIQCYPVQIQIKQSLNQKTSILLSADIKDKNNLDNCVRFTLSALSAFGPQEMDAFELSRLIEIPFGKTVYKKQDKAILLPDNDYLGFVGIRKLGDFMDTEMISEILKISPSIFVLHHIKPIPTVRANTLLIQRRKMDFFTTFSQNVYNQYCEAILSLENGKSLNEYMLCFGVKIFNKNELNDIKQQILDVLMRYQFQGVEEKWVNKAVFLTLFPEVAVCPRTFSFLSNEIAMALCLEKP